MIRPAREEDIPRLVEMGLRFHRETAYRDQVKVDPEQMAKTAQTILDGDGWLVFEDTRVNVTANTE